MEKSLTLVLPDRPGALREVAHLLAERHVSVLRANYNRVIDVHTLFLDVSGTKAHIERAEEELHALRLFPGERSLGEVHTLEFSLRDETGALEPLLALVERHGLNITQFDARSDGVADNTVRLSVHVDRREQVDALVEDASQLCPVRVLEPDQSFNVVDNSTFTINFAHELAGRLGLSEADEQILLVNSNRIMQNLMQTNADPYKPFDYISQVADALAQYRGVAYAKTCRVTRFVTAAGVRGVCVEPPVGSDTWVLECDDCLLCIDAGFACLSDELEQVLRSEYPDWDQRRRVLLLTHADIDHVGDCARFDEVYASGRVIDNFMFESLGVVSWREQDPYGMPYVFIGRILCGYKIPDYRRMRCLGEPSPFGEQRELLERIDTLEVPPFSFEVWEGKGGHVRGETMLIDRKQRVCVSGDVFVNVHGETKPQARYNALGPFLLTSVDSDPKLAREERMELFDLLDDGAWQILGGHGALYELQK